jgi:hypothetical protein
VDKPEPVEGQQETGLCLKMRQQRHIPNGPTPGGMLGLGGDEFAIFNKVSISLPALPRVQEGMSCRFIALCCLSTQYSFAAVANG